MNPIIFWFRQDLRLNDNPALVAAYKTGAPIIPLYILDDENSGDWKMGAASRVWLHHSLEKLNASLGGHLLLAKGDPKQLIPQIAQELHVEKIFWNRCYEPWQIERDKKIKQNTQFSCFSENGSLLWEPWTIKKQDGTPYKVFTPFFKKGCLGAPTPRSPLAAPSLDIYQKAQSRFCVSLEKLDLLPQKIRWDLPMISYWEIGEKAALKRLSSFVNKELHGYKEKRNIPSLDHTSKLSPHLHFGEISPNQIWHEALQAKQYLNDPQDLEHFLSELGWREFSYSLIYFHPQLPTHPLNEKFLNFQWEKEKKETLEKWQKGYTGFPIIDAGMRELWATGYMHNRVRMITASFLIKDLRYHWITGEKWFWDTLFDANLPNNAASWQWVAGCGADAAPYFRIFNPLTQGEKFDPTQEYIRKWAPDSLKRKPMLDHAQARETALALFKSL